AGSPRATTSSALTAWSATTTPFTSAAPTARTCRAAWRSTTLRPASLRSTARPPRRCRWSSSFIIFQFVEVRFVVVERQHIAERLAASARALELVVADVDNLEVLVLLVGEVFVLTVFIVAVVV